MVMVFLLTREDLDGMDICMVILIQPHIQQPADNIRYADDTDRDGILIS
jgi:hypothetical protein